MVEQFLRALDGEGGDDNVSAALIRVVDDFGEGFGDRDGVVVIAVAVGRFHDDVISPVEERGIADEGLVPLADVAREDDAGALAVLGDVHFDDGGAEDVACVVVGRGDAGRDLRGLVVFDGPEELERLLGVFHGVEWDDREGALFAFADMTLLFEFRVFFLDVCGVAEDDAGELDRGLRGVDRRAEAHFPEARDAA